MILKYVCPISTSFSTNFLPLLIEYHFTKVPSHTSNPQPSHNSMDRVMCFVFDLLPNLVHYQAGTVWESESNRESEREGDRE